MHHGTLAEHLGVSRRSVSRWTSEGTRLSRAQIEVVARLAYREDAGLAAEIAQAAGETLVSLGLEAADVAARGASPAPAKPSIHPKLADAVVCAAAEAIDVSPRLARRALLAALASAREVGMTMEELERALRPAK
jgi:UDP-N-acetylmuramyl pentapeptide synthase